MKKINVKICAYISWDLTDWLKQICGIPQDCGLELSYSYLEARKRNKEITFFEAIIGGISMATNRIWVMAEGMERKMFYKENLYTWEHSISSLKLDHITFLFLCTWEFHFHLSTKGGGRRQNRTVRHWRLPMLSGYMEGLLYYYLLICEAW